MKILLSAMIFGIFFLMINDTSAITEIESPRAQMLSGVPINETSCKNDFQLVMKKSNGAPACVKPASVEKLIQRGWALHVLSDYSSDNTNSEIFSPGKYSVVSGNVMYYENTNGFLSRPSTPGDYPGIVMIHEWWGLNDNIVEMAENLASHGYVVLAVDLFDGSVATTSEEAREQIQNFDSAKGIENMNSAISYLHDNHDILSFGSIGWCFGGGQSLNLALNNDALDATVIYYGSLVNDESQLSAINWPVLGIFAGLDQGIPVESVHDFESSLNNLGIDNQIHIYPGVDHAFANPSGERYAPDETEDAWNKTLEFLKQNLQ